MVGWVGGWLVCWWGDLCVGWVVCVLAGGLLECNVCLCACLFVGVFTCLVVFVCLLVWLVGWLNGWLWVGCLVVGSLVGWLVGCLVAWLLGCLVAWLLGWLLG